MQHGIAFQKDGPSEISAGWNDDGAAFVLAATVDGSLDCFCIKMDAVTRCTKVTDVELCNSSGSRIGAVAIRNQGLPSCLFLAA
jgi:hypothetical protein